MLAIMYTRKTTLLLSFFESILNRIHKKIKSIHPQITNIVPRIIIRKGNEYHGSAEGVTACSKINIEFSNPTSESNFDTMMLGLNQFYAFANINNLDGISKDDCTNEKVLPSDIKEMLKGVFGEANNAFQVKRR